MKPKKITPPRKLKISGPRDSKKDQKRISRKTKLNELLSTNPEAASILFESGMGCVECPMMMQETIEEGCLAHGMSKKDIDELIKRLNEK